MVAETPCNGESAPDLSGHAMRYADEGFHVFPCEVQGKIPLTAHGFNDARADSEFISRMWAHYGIASNIGISCGPSGVWVLDVDGERGEASLAEIAKNRPIPTAIVRTARGWHYWFRGDGVGSRSGVRPGLDTRGVGGYVIAPPSIHESGWQYRWETSLDDIAEAPDWLLDALRPSEVLAEAQSLTSSIGAIDDAEERRLFGALQWVPADERETWLRVGCALHHADAGGERGYSIWHRWSMSSPTAYDPKDQRSTWDHLRVDHRDPVTLASVYALAQARGWVARIDGKLPTQAGVIRRAWCELDQRWLYEAPPPQRYLVERPDAGGYLPAGRVTLVASAGGTGKTYMLLALAVAICARRRWLDLFSIGTGVAPRVAVLLGEEDAAEAQRRIYRACAGLELDDAELCAVQQGLVLLPLAAEVAPLVATEGDRVQQSAEMRDLLALLAEGGPWGAIIIDPLARFASAEVEARNDFATQSIQHFETLTKAPGSPAVLVACHSSKEARRGGKADVRGVTGLHDAARAVLELVADSADLVRLRLAKSNLGPPAEDLFLRRRPGGILSGENEAERSIRERDAEEANPAAQRRAAKEKEKAAKELALMERAIKVVSANPGLSKSTAAERIGGNDAAARRALGAAVEMELLVEKREGCAHRYYAPDDVPSADPEPPDDAREVCVPLPLRTTPVRRSRSRSAGVAAPVAPEPDGAGGATKRRRKRSKVEPKEQA